MSQASALRRAWQQALGRTARTYVPPSITGYSLSRRVLAGLFGVQLPARPLTSHSNPPAGRDSAEGSTESAGEAMANVPRVVTWPEGGTTSTGQGLSQLPLDDFFTAGY